MELQPITHDETYDEDTGNDIFDDDIRHESIIFMLDDMGEWYVKVTTCHPGFAGHTYWRLTDEPTNEALMELLSVARERIES